MKRSFDILILGGGAAGLVAAIAAKRQGGDISVAVLEKEDRVGKKLLRTGNGRCNITNKNVCEDRYHGTDPEFTEAAFDRFPVQTVVRFFESIGVVTEFWEDGRAYPLSYQASSVLDALRFACDELGVEIFCSQEVRTIKPQKGGFNVLAENEFFAKRLIVAAGSSAGLKNQIKNPLAQLGHTVLPSLPAIVTLKTDPFFVRQLKGIKFEGEISALAGETAVQTAAGEILFTEDGLSGPPSLDLSRLISHKKADRVSLNILPKLSFERLCEMLKSRRAVLGNRTLENFFTGMVNKRLGQIVMKYCGFSLADRADSLSDEQLELLAYALKDFRIKAIGTGPLSQAQAAAGGALTAEFSPLTLESKKHPGLYAAGEVLDIDGDCGGFNLQWAWSSGLLSAESACRSLSEE